MLITRDRLSNAGSVLVLADHEFDPRLRRKILWIEEIFSDVVICRNQRAEWFRSEGFPGDRKVLDYDDDRSIANFAGGLCYVSGARILRDKFRVLSSLRRKNRVIVEVPDLPLRSRFWLKNKIIETGFRTIFGLVADAGVITAPDFLTGLPPRRPYLVSENCPEEKIALALQAIDPPGRIDRAGESVHIGFVGAVRYGEQIRLLLRYASRRKGIVVHIFGGPVEAFYSVLEIERKATPGLKDADIKVHGAFDFERDICDIYKALDILYAVYDARQPNVRLALPNKLYEAALARRYILAAEGTAFAAKVEEAGIGGALPFELKDYPRFETKLDAFLQLGSTESCRSEYALRTLELCRAQKGSFQEFLSDVVRGNINDKSI